MAEEPEIDAGYINRAVFANAHEAKKQRLPIEAEPIRRTVRTFIQARKRNPNPRLSAWKQKKRDRGATGVGLALFFSGAAGQNPRPICMKVL